MTDREILLADALRRVLEVADVTAGPVDPTAIHDAVGWELITELCFEVDDDCHPDPFVEEPCTREGCGHTPGEHGWTDVGHVSEDDYRWAPTDTSVVDSYHPSLVKAPKRPVDEYTLTKAWPEVDLRPLVKLHENYAQDLARETLLHWELRNDQTKPAEKPELTPDEEAQAQAWFEENRKEIYAQRREVIALRNRTDLHILVPPGSTPKGVVGGRAFCMPIYENPAVDRPMVVPAPRSAL